MLICNKEVFEMGAEFDRKPLKVTWQGSYIKRFTAAM